MALTNLNKETQTKLFSMLALNDSNIEIVKSHSASYAKLGLIAEQIYELQQKAKEIILDAEKNKELHNINITCKKVPGKYYYHYLNNGKDQLSIISPKEWSSYDEFKGCYLYDYDNNFYKINYNIHNPQDVD